MSLCSSSVGHGATSRANSLLTSSGNSERIKRGKEGKMIVNFDLLVAETAKAFQVEAEDILGPRRTALASVARHVVMALWADHHPYQDASNRCNRGCHSTAMWARQRVLNMAEIDHSFALIVAGISKRCQYGQDELPEETPSEEEKVQFFSVSA